MLQNASYTFLKNETKRIKRTTKKRKKSHPAGVEPKTFDVQGQRFAILKHFTVSLFINYHNCATQPLLNCQSNCI